MGLKNKKHNVVVFTKNNARLLKIWSRDLSHYKKILPQNYMVDPDMSKVRGTPPHFWKPALIGNKLVPKNHAEKMAIILSHKIRGVDNYIKLKRRFWWRRYVLRWYNVLLGLAGGLYYIYNYQPEWWNTAVGWLDIQGIDLELWWYQGKIELIELLKGVIKWLM